MSVFEFSSLILPRIQLTVALIDDENAVMSNLANILGYAFTGKDFAKIVIAVFKNQGKV